MARGASGAARIVINRAKVDEVTLRVADGIFQAAQEAIHAARPPVPENGRYQLVARGGAIGFVGGKRFAVFARHGMKGSVKKPRAAKANQSTIVVVGGFGFPARFIELGSVHNYPAKPFLTPVFMPLRDRIPALVRAACASTGPVSQPSGGGE
jgi:hypothetical protein